MAPTGNALAELDLRALYWVGSPTLFSAAPMVHLRTLGADLARLLNSVSRPVYVLDDEQTIVFCNAACLEWVGRTAEELVGRQCRYHSHPEVTELEAVAAGLCPPAEAMAGKEWSATVACLGPNHELRRRRARFVPLDSGSGGPVALVALVETEDLPEIDGVSVSPPDSASESAWLHDRVRSYRQQVAWRFQPDRLIGDSPSMRLARCQAALALESGASVLLVGPPGAGRQHLARVIHHAGKRRPAGSFIPLACSALGADLIQSTATALAAKFARSEEGHTLLLNDADQLPAEVQCELTLLLGSKGFPLRLVSTAARPLAELAAEGRYRPQLAALLSTIAIRLPPLAERREDVPLLAQTFLEELNARGGKQLSGFSPEALDRLIAYPWPGNVDELARMVAESFQRAQGCEVAVGDLPKRIHLAADAASHPRRREETIVLDEFLGRIERELIERALRRAKGNKTKAAHLLGMTRPRLYRRLVQLGMAEGEGGEADSPQGS